MTSRGHDIEANADVAAALAEVARCLDERFQALFGADAQGAEELRALLKAMRALNVLIESSSMKGMRATRTELAPLAGAVREHGRALARSAADERAADAMERATNALLAAVRAHA